MRWLAVALTTLSLFGAEASAATWFVSPTGRDANRGSIDAPLRTLSAAVTRLKPGDRLLVRGGVYRESVRIWNKAGSASAPIYISPYGKEPVAIDGQGSGDDAVVSIGDSSWIFFDRFEVRNGPGKGILIYDSQQVRVRWNNVHDHDGSGIQVSSGSGSPRGTAHHIVVQGNRVYRTVMSNEGGRSGRWSQAVAAWRSANITIAGNYVSENYGEGIDAVLSDRVVIAANHVWDNFAVDIYLDNATNVVVDRNFVATDRAPGARRYYRQGRGAIGIAVANEEYAERSPSRALTITNNIVVSCRFALAYGDWGRGGGIREALIANNTFYGQAEAAIYLEPAHGGKHSAVRVMNNIILQRGDRPYVDGSSDGLAFQSNCWWGGASGTARPGRGDVVADPRLADAGGGGPEGYRLSSGSPCINRGTAERAVRTDFRAVSRRGFPDIGADERG